MILRQSQRFLPGVPSAQVEAAFAAAPGNEIATGKFGNPAPSAALEANTFGFFLDHPGEMPPLPGYDDAMWPTQTHRLEATLRFP